MSGPRSANISTPTRKLNDNGWSPTVANLVVLVALEIAGYCLLRWAFRTAHGG
jgi:hypothetical protein